MMDHFFFTLFDAMTLWHKLFNLVKLDWVLLRSICNMMTISFKGLGSTCGGKTLWKIACPTFDLDHMTGEKCKDFQG